MNCLPKDPLGLRLGLLTSRGGRVIATCPPVYLAVESWVKQSLRRAVMGRRQTRVDVCRRSCIQLDLDHTLAAVDRLIHSDAWGMGVSGPENSETLPSFQGDLICGAVIEPDVPIRAGPHLLGHVLQRRDADLLLPLDQELNIDILAVGFRRIIDNPAVAMLPVDYVNDPAIIARHPKFMSVNAALEVDFYGQVCAESIGTRHISGTGGQSDYVRGAIQSEGGKSFIAFSSTAGGGEVSRIVPTLTPGACVSTSKNDVDCIVTEYGIAKLRGKTLSQRTKALIAIAHPKFRDELTYQAKKENIMI